MNLSCLFKALVLPLMVAATAAPAQTPKPIRIGVMTDMAGVGFPSSCHFCSFNWHC